MELCFFCKLGTISSRILWVLTSPIWPENSIQLLSNTTHLITTYLLLFTEFFQLTRSFLQKVCSSMIIAFYSSHFDCVMHHNFVNITAPWGIEIMICITYLNYIMLIICSASWTVSSIYGWDYDKRGRRQFSKAKRRCCIIYFPPCTEAMSHSQSHTQTHVHRIRS